MYLGCEALLPRYRHLKTFLKNASMFAALKYAKLLLTSTISSQLRFQKYFKLNEG